MTKTELFWLSYPIAFSSKSQHLNIHCLFFFFKVKSDWLLRCVLWVRLPHHQHISLLLSTAEHRPPQLNFSVARQMPPASNDSLQS